MHFQLGNDDFYVYSSDKDRPLHIVKLDYNSGKGPYFLYYTFDVYSPWHPFTFLKDQEMFSFSDLHEIDCEVIASNNSLTLKFKIIRSNKSAPPWHGRHMFHFQSNCFLPSNLVIRCPPYHLKSYGDHVISSTGTRSLDASWYSSDFPILETRQDLV